MICQRWMHPGWLSNTWLVADRKGGEAIIIDTGADPEPVVEAARSLRLSVRWILNTHHHVDHTQHNGALKEVLGGRIAAHSIEARLIRGVDRRLSDEETLQAGEIECRVLHVPGHTAGHIALVVRSRGMEEATEAAHVFTGDSLFRRSVGGTVAPGHTTFEDLRRSLIDRILALPPETVVHPGHTLPTTVGEELSDNPFVQVMRGLAPEGAARCGFAGRPARLIVWARDYDGGHKAWVRFEDGEDAVVPGSRVSL